MSLQGTPSALTVADSVKKAGNNSKSSMFQCVQAAEAGRYQNQF